jgi:hypothetical protein
MFGQLMDSLRVRVPSDPLACLNELNEIYKDVLQKNLTLKLDKDPNLARIQENIVLHALQMMYKHNLERYIRSINVKTTAAEKAKIVEFIQNEHKKIITQRTDMHHPVDIPQLLKTLLQATSPRASLPSTILHAPSEGIRWQSASSQQAPVNIAALEAELRQIQSSEDLADKVDKFRTKLQNATQNPDERISTFAKESLSFIDLMINIPLMSQKYQTLSAKLALQSTKSDREKNIIGVRDQMERIEDKLRKAAIHSDPRINVLATAALAENHISDQKIRPNKK